MCDFDQKIIGNYVAARLSNNLSRKLKWNDEIQSSIGIQTKTSTNTVIL